MKILRAIQEGNAMLKAASVEPPPWGSRPGTAYGGLRALLTTDRDWAQEAGDVWLNGVVLPVEFFKARAISEARPRLEVFNPATRLWEESPMREIRERDYLDRFLNPNDDHGWKAIAYGWQMGTDVAGNAYCFKRYDNQGRVIGYRWEPPHLLRPDTRDPSVLLDTYEYGVPNGPLEYLPKAKVVHIRAEHRDPRERRLGLSPLSSQCRDIVADNELSSWLAAMLMNGAAPEWLFVPKLATEFDPTKWISQAKEFARLWNRYRRDNRGGAATAPGPIDAVKLNHSPEELQLDSTRQGPLTRICVALGGDPMAFGFPSANKTYANGADAIDAFGKRTMVPSLWWWAEQFGAQTLADFGLDPKSYRLGWDFSGVSWLADETEQRHRMHRDDFKAGLTDLFEYRRLVGLEARPEHRGVTYFQMLAMSKAPALAPSEGTQARALLHEIREARRVQGR